MNKRQKKGNRWMIWLAGFLALLLAGGLLLPRIWMRPAPAGMMLTNTTKPVVGAGSGITGKSYCDQGIFMLSRTNTLMRFFEYKTKKTYVMCGNSFCSHSNADCPAWYDYRHPTVGLASYCGVIYALIWNDVRGAYELCSMQLDGTGRTALAELPKTAVTLSDGSRTQSTVTDVVYSGGYAWITFAETQETEAKENWEVGMQWNFNRYYGVELSTGRIHEIEFPVSVSYGNSVRFEFATDEVLIFCVTEKEPRLSEREFNAARERGEYLDIEPSELFPDLYDAYCYFWEQDIDAAYTYYRYDISSGALTALESGTCTNGTIDPHMFFGEYEGKLLVEDHTNEYKTIDSDPYYRWGRQNRNFLWDIDTGEQVDLFTGPGILMSQYSDMSGHITLEGLVFYRKYLEDKRVENYSYSLETGESRYMFTYEFDDEVPFEIYSETPTQFIGCYQDKLCALDKDDYMNGDFEKSQVLGTL